MSASANGGSRWADRNPSPSTALPFDPFASRLRGLEFLRRGEPISRTEIARETGLGQATVSVITRELLDAGILREETRAGGSRGRPRIDLMTNSDSLIVAGAFVDWDGRTTVHIGNLGGAILAEATTAPPVGVEADTTAEIVESISLALKEARKGLPHPDRAIAALGVSLPAMVDAQGGVIHWRPPAEPTRQPLAQLLAQRLGLPVYLDNIGNTTAMAQRWFGQEAFNDDLCVVLVGAGVAMAQYVDGVIHRGAHGFNPEFGHVKTGVGADLPCSCGARGCLALVAGLMGMTHLAITRLGWRGDVFTSHRAAFAWLREKSASGDCVARDILDQGGHALGIALANHIAVWDPSHIIVLAEDDAWESTVAPGMHAHLQAAIPDMRRDALSLEIRIMQPGILPRGAIALAMDGIFRARDLTRWNT